MINKITNDEFQEYVDKLNEFYKKCIFIDEAIQSNKYTDIPGVLNDAFVFNFIKFNNMLVELLEHIHNRQNIFVSSTLIHDRLKCLVKLDYIKEEHMECILKFNTAFDGERLLSLNKDTTLGIIEYIRPNLKTIEDLLNYLRNKIEK